MMWGLVDQCGNCGISWQSIGGAIEGFCAEQ